MPALLSDLRALVKALEERGAIDEDEPLGVVQSRERSWALTDRLSQDQIRDIVQDRLSGLLLADTAKKYGISESSVKRIMQRYRTDLKDGELA